MPNDNDEADARTADDSVAVAADTDEHRCNDEDTADSSNASVANISSSDDASTRDPASSALSPVAGSARDPAPAQLPRHPFDPRTSHRNAFPNFDDALRSSSALHANDDSDNEVDSDTSALLDDTRIRNDARQGINAASNLDWSIDTIAEMKPMAFSPLPEQRSSSTPPGAAAATSTDTDTAATSSTSRNRDRTHEFTPSPAAKRAHFFDDETQYNVLQTPSPLIRQQAQQEQEQAAQCEAPTCRHAPPQEQPLGAAAAVLPTQRHTPPGTPSASPAALRAAVHSALSSNSHTHSSLHNRCQDAIAFFAHRLHERQRQLSRLQLPTATPRRNSKSNSNNATPPPSLSLSTLPRLARNNNNKRRFETTTSAFPWQTTPTPTRGIHPRATLSFTSPFHLPLTPIHRAPTRAATSSTVRPTKPASAYRSAAAGAAGASQHTTAAAATMSCAFDDSLLLSPILKRSLAHELSGVATPSFESPSSPFERGRSDDDENEENGDRNQQQQSPQHNASCAASTGLSPPSRAATATSTWSHAAENGLSLKTLAMLHPTAAPRPPLPSIDTQEQQRQQEPLLSPSIAQRQESFVAAIEASTTEATPT